MNIQQIQYVLALAETRHFERAAERCFSDQRVKFGIEKIEHEVVKPNGDRLNYRSEGKIFFLWLSIPKSALRLKTLVFTNFL